MSLRFKKRCAPLNRTNGSIAILPRLVVIDKVDDVILERATQSLQLALVAVTLDI